jgi:hypothetical protein
MPAGVRQVVALRPATVPMGVLQVKFVPISIAVWAAPAHERERRMRPHGNRLAAKLEISAPAERGQARAAMAKRKWRAPAPRSRGRERAFVAVGPSFAVVLT